MVIPVGPLLIMSTRLWSTTRAHQFPTRTARPSLTLHLQAPSYLTEQNMPSPPGDSCLTEMSMLHHQGSHINGIHILCLKITQLVTNTLLLSGHLHHSLWRNQYLTMIGPSFPIPPYCHLLQASVMKLAHRIMLILRKLIERMYGAGDIIS